jgi:hypothetical protein
VSQSIPRHRKRWTAVCTAAACLIASAVCADDGVGDDAVSDDPASSEVSVSADQVHVELRAPRPTLFGTTAVSFDTCGPGYGIDNIDMEGAALTWEIARAPRDAYDVAIRLRDGGYIQTFRQTGLSAGVAHEIRADESPAAAPGTLRLTALQSPLCLRVMQKGQSPAALAQTVSEVAGVWVDGIQRLPTDQRLTFRIEGIQVSEVLSMIADTSGLKLNQLDETHYAFAALPDQSDASR